MKKSKTTEVKFVLDPNKALAEKYSLSNEATEFLQVEEAGKHMRIWYLDTDSQSLKGENWIVRYRYLEGSDFELTYKKRFSKHEFETYEESKGLKDFKGFELEVDMSFSKSTYSLSYVKLFPLTKELKDLNKRTAINVAIDCAPKVILDWRKRNFGLQKLTKAQLYGPVYAMNYKGKFGKQDLTIEVWKLDDYFFEVSADVKNDKADDFHEKILKELQKQHFVLAENTLKTEAFFDYYAQHIELVK